MKRSTRPASAQSQWRLWGVLVACGALVAAAAGCVSDEPERRAIRSQPTDIAPDTLWLGAKPFADSDSNGYLDTVDLTVYLFSDQYPEASLYVPGAFEFALVTKDAKELARWAFDSAAAREHAKRLAPGPCYLFSLSLLEKGSDEFDPQTANLTAAFIPQAGKPVKAHETGMRVGKVGR